MLGMVSLEWEFRAVNIEAAGSFGKEGRHEGELRTFHMARRKLDKYRFPAGKIPVHTWE